MGSHRREDLVASDSTTNSLHIDELKKSISGVTWGSLLKEIFSSSRTAAEPKVWALGVVDRVARTLVQAAVGYVTAVQLIASPENFNLYQFLGIIVGAAVVSVGTSLITAPTFFNSWWYQILERGVKTFAQVFISAMVTTTIAGVAFSALPTGILAVLSTSGIAALTSVVTSITSTSIGETNSVDLVTPQTLKKNLE